MLDTPLQLVSTAAHKSHGDMCFQLNFIVLWRLSLSSSSSSSSVLTAADSRVKCWVSRPNVCLCHRAVVVTPEGGMVTVSVPVYNTDTRIWLYRTGRSTTLTQEYDCTEQAALQHWHKNMTVQNRPLYNTDTRTWLYRTGRSTTLTQEYDCTEQAALQHWHKNMTTEQAFLPHWHKNMTYRTGRCTTLTHTNYRYKPETSHWLYTSHNDTV